MPVGTRRIIRNNAGDISTSNPFPVTSLNSFVTQAFDYISVAYPTGTTEVYTYKTGGATGTVVATLTVVYTDATKANLSSVTKA